jgi:hypothetical protein
MENGQAQTRKDGGDFVPTLDSQPVELSDVEQLDVELVPRCNIQPGLGNIQPGLGNF